jgi:O-antigen/teichoic acid export membrane protein
MATAAAAALRADGDALLRARRSALAVFAIRVAAAGLAYGTQVLLARLMGRDSYGVFATAWVWIAVLGHGSLGGFGISVCRFLPQHRVRGELDLVRGFLAAGAAVGLAGGAAVAVIGAGLLWLARDLVSAEYVLPFAIALCVVPVFALQDYVEGVARSFNWTALAIAPPFIIRQGLIAVAMLLAIAWGAPAEPWVAVGCTLFATAVAVAVQAGILLRRLRTELPPGARAYRLREWTAATLPIGFADWTLVLFGFVDVLLLGLFLPPSEVGVYFAATRLLQFIVFAQYAATAATAPRFAEAWTRGDHETLRQLVRARSGSPRSRASGSARGCSSPRPGSSPCSARASKQVLACSRSSSAASRCKAPSGRPRISSTCWARRGAARSPRSERSCSRLY